MILKYTLQEKDYIQNLLFNASSQQNILSKLKRSRIFLCSSLIIASLIFFNNGELTISISLLIFTVLSLLFYLQFEKRRYFKHYTRHIQRIHKNLDEKEMTLQFSEDFIFASDENIESKISYSELTSIYEIKDYFFIYIKGEQSFIIPKRQISDILRLEKYLQEISIQLNISYQRDLHWKW